jgi:hypothetical protein
MPNKEEARTMNRFDVTLHSNQRPSKRYIWKATKPHTAAHYALMFFLGGYEDGRLKKGEEVTITIKQEEATQ